MKRILTHGITPPMFMLAPDGAGGGGSGGDLPAPPAGGDGGNGGGDPGGSGGDGDGLSASQRSARAEIENFEPPSLDFLEDKPAGDGGNTPADDAAKKAADDAAAKKAADDAAAKKKADEEAKKKTDEPPVAQLRKEYEAVKKERDELKAKADRVSALEAQLLEFETLKKTRDELTGERDKLKQELQIRDPLARAELDELAKGFDDEMRPFMEDMPSLAKNSGAAYARLLKSFMELPTEPEKRETALADFRREVADTVGDENVAAAFDALRRGKAYMGKRDSLESKLRTDAERMAFERGEKNWSEADKSIAAELTSALTVPEGIETSDPFNPILGINRLLEAMPDKGAKLKGNAEQFVRRLFAGPKPRSDKEFPGLQPEEIRQRIAAEQAWHKEAKPLGVRTLVQGLLALAAYRPLLAELAKYRDAEKKRSDAQPPDPNTGKGGDGKGGDADVDAVVGEARSALGNL